MNMHASPQLTAAETALVDGYVARMSELPGDAGVTVRRDEAVERIKAGLPTRRNEAWHYTDLRRLLTAVPEFDPAARVETLPPLLDNASVLRVSNGIAAAPAPLEGVTIERLAERLEAGRIDPAGNAADADAIGAINEALVSDGYAIAIEAGVELAMPIELQNLHGGGQVHAGFEVKAGAGARATIIERQTGSAPALASSVSDIEVADGAEIVWVIVQEQPQDATHLARIQARLGKGARLTLFIMNAGGRLVRQEVRAAAAGAGSVFTLRGVNLLGGQTHCDVTMVLDHLGYGATSTEVVRNVVTDKAHGVFQGQIRVDREAQKTDAKMACNTLLLSDDAEFSTKPELEIFADDVACGHGATVTDIDHDHLFYLMARGIPENEARRLLVKAFIAEVIEDLEDEVLVEALEARLETWFAERG